MRPKTEWPRWAALVATISAFLLFSCAEEKTSGPCGDRPAMRDPVWHVDTLATSDQVWINGIWMDSETEAYAVGGVGDTVTFRGVIWYYDGTSWSEVFSKQGASFEDVHGTSSQNVWAVGGLVRDLYYFGQGFYAIHWDGHQWTESLVDSSKSALSSVWAQSEGDVYAGSYNGKILHWNGVNWISEPFEISQSGSIWISDFWGFSSQCSQRTEEIYATVFWSGGRLLRRAGSDWVVEMRPSSRSIGFAGVWGQDPQGLYVLDIPDHQIVAFGSVLWREDTTWSATGINRAEGTFAAIRGDAWGTVYVVRWGGVYRLVGDSVIAYDVLPPSEATDAWISGLTMMVVGKVGTSGVAITGTF